jgi:hypothetical protein
MDGHLGYALQDPANSRNGKRAKSVLTEAGPVEIAVSRDRDSSFEPRSSSSGRGACPVSMCATGAAPAARSRCRCRGPRHS